MKNTIFKISFAALLALTTVSCNDFLDVNVDPNSPVKENLNLDAKLPAALVTSANYEATTLNQIGGFWGGYWGTSNEGVTAFASLKNYNGLAIRDSRDGIPVWESTYANLFYYKEILDQANAEGAGYYAGIAKIMMAYHYFILVDFYNNVPFDDALKGSSMLHPRYDSGKDVYEKSIELINVGIEDIKAGALSPTKDDVLFAGNKSKWVQFGNTLKLRALLRQSAVTEQDAYIKQELRKIEQEGSGFISQDAAINPGYVNSTGKMDPFFETYYRNNAGVAVANHTNIRPTKFLIETYSLHNDPRLKQSYVAVNDDFKGVIFGHNTIEDQYAAGVTSAFKGPQENAGKPAGFLKSFNQSTMLISAAESYFLQAEGAARGWISGSLNDYYTKGVQASFDYYFNQNGYDIGAYILQDAVDINKADNKVERIITQKWLALAGINNIVAWHDFRRTGYPKFPNSAQATGNDVYPLRFMYPESEINNNNENVLKQGDNNILSSRVWWNVR